MSNDEFTVCSDLLPFANPIASDPKTRFRSGVQSGLSRCVLAAPSKGRSLPPGRNDATVTINLLICGRGFDVAPHANCNWMGNAFVHALGLHRFATICKSQSADE
jgi:hypothetical protein